MILDSRNGGNKGLLRQFSAPTDRRRTFVSLQLQLRILMYFIVVIESAAADEKWMKEQYAKKMMTLVYKKSVTSNPRLVYQWY